MIAPKEREGRFCPPFSFITGPTMDVEQRGKTGWVVGGG
jgi:hypothetical protein